MTQQRAKTPLTRRAYLATASTATVGMFAGCTSSGSSHPNTLRIATNEAFVNAVSTSAGDWVKKEFERRHDGVTLEWVIKKLGVNDFIRRRNQDAPLEADAYLGVTPTDLVRAERVLGDDTPLFTAVNDVNTSAIIDKYWFDPQRRIIPTGASYVCIVYNGTKISGLESFDALLREEYEDGLLLANPQTTVTGLDFLLWTIHNRGRDSYLDYWQQLMDNGVHILKSWNTAYSAYENGAAPMVVSYSTDQIYAVNGNKPIKEHQISFPNNEGYAYVSGFGKFATTEQDELCKKFAQFLLTPDVQRRTAVLNVGLPTVENVSLPEKYQSYAKKPAKTIQYSTDVLRKHADKWQSTWARQIASG